MSLRHHLDLALVALLIGGFVFVAAQRLATVPVPDTDESYMLQTPYEMLYRGKLALPLRRFLGGNVENTWHSLTPLYYVIESGFLKMAGWGLLQGRIFNLLTVVLTLLMVYLIGRRLFDWRAGLIAVVMITSDQTVLERSRLLRNDYAAEAFALLAFYLYEIAEERKSGRFFVASGLAAGAGLMCHTSILYMLAAIFFLMLLRNGWKIFSSKKLYQFAAGAFAVSAYEIVYDIVDYKTFLLQYRDDQMHFGFLSPSGWLTNLLDEPTRYVRWYTAYDVTFQNVPRTLLHLFQFLTIVAIISLIARCVRSMRRGKPMNEPRVRLLVVTLVMALFFANVAHKLGYYNAHLVTWFGLCVGSMSSDALNLVRRFQLKQTRAAALLHIAAWVLVLLVVIAYAGLLMRQQTRYLTELRNPNLASFEEITGALHSIVPDAVCPVAVKAPVFWLAFPEKDRCFGTIERRMDASVEIEGREYALLVRPKSPDYWARDLVQQHHLLGGVTDTPYGNFLVYYTGADPRYLALAPKHFHFFRRWRGLVTEEQIASAHEVWSATVSDLSESLKLGDSTTPSKGVAIQAGSRTSRNPFVEVCSVELRSGTAYQLLLDATCSVPWEVVIIDEKTGTWIKQIEIGASDEPHSVEELFRTLSDNRVRIAVRPHHEDAVDPLYVKGIRILEVARL